MPDVLVGHVEPVLFQLALAPLLATPEGLVSKIKIFIFTCFFFFPCLFHVYIYLLILILLYLTVKKSGSQKQEKSDQNLENETTPKLGQTQTLEGAAGHRKADS